MIIVRINCYILNKVLNRPFSVQFFSITLASRRICSAIKKGAHKMGQSQFSEYCVFLLRYSELENSFTIINFNLNVDFLP
jgi:hypothetical protein